MRTLLFLSVIFCLYHGHGQQDPLVGKWQRVAFNTHEWANDKLKGKDTGTADFIEEFPTDGTLAGLTDYC